MHLVLANLLGIDTPIVILIAIVLLFGAPQIPKLGRNLGMFKSEFEKGQKTAEKKDDEPPAPPSPPPAGPPPSSPPSQS